MSKFGIIPPEPPRVYDLHGLAPKVQVAVNRVLADMGPNGIIYESTRTDERQRWLYGFGRLYDDGRGIVTHAQTAQYGWHFFGLAVDIIHRTLEWDASIHWWESLAQAYERYGMDSGKRWRQSDKPHGQWGKCRTTPSELSRGLYQNGGLVDVWKAVDAA